MFEKSELPSSLGYDSQNQDEIPRDLSIGEAFGRSFDLARRNYLTLLPIFAVFGIIAAILGALITAATPSLASIPIPQNSSTVTPTQAIALLDSFVRYVVFAASNFFVTSIILYFAVGVGVWKLLTVLGQKQNLGFTLPDRLNYLNLALTTVLAVIIIELSGLLVVGPLIFGTMFYLCLAVSVSEGRSLFDTFGRSRKLISGKWGKTFILFIGTQIIVYIGAGLISQIVNLFVTSLAIVSIIQNFILALELPLVSASMVVLYLSYRNSQELITRPPPSLYDNLKPQPMPGFGNRNFCSACGASVSPDEKFCHNCGAALSTQR